MLTSKVKKELGSSVLRYIRKQLDNQNTRRVLGEIELKKLTTQLTDFLNQGNVAKTKTTFNQWSVVTDDNTLVAVKGSATLRVTQNAGVVFMTDEDKLFQQIIGGDTTHLVKKITTYFEEN